MEEKITFSKEFITILDDLGERIGVAIDWTSENVIPYLTDLFHRYINYILTRDILLLLFAIFGIIVCIFFAKKLIKAYKQAKIEKQDNLFMEYESYSKSVCLSGVSIATLVFGIFIFTFSLVSSIILCAEIIKLIFIPEVYMIEYLSQYL